MMGNWSMKNLPAARRQAAAQNTPGCEGGETSRLSCLFCHAAGWSFSLRHPALKSLVLKLCALTA